MAETITTKKAAPRAKGGGEKTCTVGGCKRATARRGSASSTTSSSAAEKSESRPARYDTCSKADCKKKVVEHGLCQDHFEAWKKSRKKNQAAAPA